MAQIVYKPGIQELIGTGLGQGLSSGLQGLANQKLAQMQQGKLAQSLQGLQGWSPQEAQAFSMLPPQVQSQFLKQKMQAPQNANNAQLVQQILSGSTGNESGENPSLNIPGGITDKQLGDIARIHQKQQQIGQKERIHNEEQYDKVVGPLRESYGKNKQLDNYYDSILELSELSNVPRGAIPALADKFGIPTSLYADTLGETLDKLLKGNVVRKAALTGKSRGAGEKLIKTLSESEGTLKNSKEGLRSIIQASKALETYPEIIKYQIADELSNKYISAGKPLPRNFLEIVNKKVDEEVSKKFNKLIKDVKRVNIGLPDPSQVEPSAPGEEIRWKTNKGDIWVIRNGDWEKE